ncbi:hypothetical protein PC118_g22637 [Phytophthora cactorum]|uniref:Uncharacterized protein n=1 Tax=Phytophthora cactorum TaxID=29920 RepID=A0A8T1F310_9STRA|nr:hypothetical protein PC118_g22637 [Phytophthora cactorum]
MTKSTKNAAEATSDEDSLRAHLEEESEEGDESAPLHAATELWSRLCATLAANSHLTGVEALDRLVFKVLADDSFPVALEEVMPILPAPDLMEVGHAQDHSVVKTPTTRARIKRSSSFTPAKAPPAKQERPAKQKAKAHFSFDLPTGVDAALVRGLERIIKISEGYSKTPPRMEDPLSLVRPQASLGASLAALALLEALASALLAAFAVPNDRQRGRSSQAQCKRSPI